MEYLIKVYDKTKSFKDIINEREIKSDISFTKQINGWAWHLNIILDWLKNNIIQWDIIEIYYKTSLIYVGFVWEINFNISNFYETELNVYWLASLFNNIIYNVAWNYTANINQYTYNTAQDIVNFMNTFYNYFTLSWSLSIIWDDIVWTWQDSTWTWDNFYWITLINWNYDLNYTNCLILLNELRKISNNYFYLDNYNLIFADKPTTATHNFTLWLDIEKININDDTTGLFNYLILKYKSWTQVYSDTNSINTYWRKEKYIENTNIADLSSANSYWNTFISENKNPKKKISLIINKNYTNNINPWETCKILNTKLNLNNNLQINKISYSKDKFILDLEGYDNFINLIK